MAQGAVQDAVALVLLCYNDSTAGPSELDLSYVRIREVKIILTIYFRYSPLTVCTAHKNVMVMYNNSAYVKVRKQHKEIGGISFNVKIFKI